MKISRSRPDRSYARRCARSGGFTLIELLVVIAIISALMAILMPSLSVAKQRAKETKCAAQLRDLAVGIHSYALANHDYTCSGSFDPEVSNGRDGPVDRVGWVADLVNEGTAHPGESLCPTNPALFNQKLGVEAAGSDSYTEDEARDLVARGYNTNYTQSWYMARTEWRPGRDYNLRRVSATVGPLRLGRWTRVTESRIPLLSDGRTDLDNLVLGERSIKTMTDGPYGGPYGTQDYADFGPAHGGGPWVFGLKDHNFDRANVLFGDGHVAVFEDRDHDGEFGLNDEVIPADQKDLDEHLVFDGVLSIGCRSDDEMTKR